MLAFAIINFFCFLEESRKLASQENEHVNQKISEDELWKPHPPTDDCPLCCVPLPLESTKRVYFPCCSMQVCYACSFEHHRSVKKLNREQTCAFCRAPSVDRALCLKQYEKRLLKDDADAIMNLGMLYLEGKSVQKDEAKALSLVQRAADLGSSNALTYLGRLCMKMEGMPGFYGNGKCRDYLEQASKKGSVDARMALAHLELRDGNVDLAIKHYCLAAEAGDKAALKEIRKQVYEKNLAESDLNRIVRAHNKARDEMNSEQRERYEAFMLAGAKGDNMRLLLYAGYYSGNISASDLKAGLKEIELKTKHGARVSTSDLKNAMEASRAT